MEPHIDGNEGGGRPPQGADSYLLRISRTLEGAKIAWALFTPE